jgi:hypothetical protein
MSQAVDTCVAEIEQGGERIASVDAASRDADGWRVSGELDGGAGYWCRIDGDGRVSGIGGSGTAYAEPVAEQRYDDAYYARARASKAQAGEADEMLGEDDGHALAQAAE